MEKRNLQRTGGSSFTITVPKQWVEDMALKDRDPLELHIQPGGAILIKPVTAKKKYRKSILRLQTHSGERVMRELVALYLSGSDEITIEGSRITSEQRAKVRAIIQSLIGMEIIEETSTHIIVRNIFDASKFPIQQNIEKMFLMAKSMFSDAITAVTKVDTVLARDVIVRDTEVDKLHFMLIRQFRSLLTNTLSEDDIRLSLVDCNYYAFVATQVERIADHAVKIAEYVDNLREKVKDESFTETIKNSSDELKKVLEKCSRMVQTLDVEIAHSVLDSYGVFEKKGNKEEEKLKAITPIVADSFERVRRYILNIAEMTIDQSVIKSIKV